MAAQRHVYQCILRLEHTLRLRVPNFDAPQDSDCVIKIVFSLAAARGDPAVVSDLQRLESDVGAQLRKVVAALVPSAC